MQKIVIFLLTLTLIGCASAPTEEQLQNADYGNYQSPNDCVRLAEARIKSTLKDPTSAIFSHSSCMTGYAPKVPLMGLPVEFGYWQNGTVNAKNSFGGYVGSRKYDVLIRNGRVVRWCVADENGICMPSR